MPSIHRMIWNKFHVHADTLRPMRGWKGTRITLAQLFADLGYTRGAEIGVEFGYFSEVLCRENPKLKLKCVDPWAPYGRSDKAKEDGVYDKAVERLRGFPGTEIIRLPSMEAVKDVPDVSLDFVYIDALHDFDSVIKDLLFWVPKVRMGGMISGHDFTVAHNMGVTQAVTAYTTGHAINLYYITNEQIPSWFWVRE